MSIEYIIVNWLLEKLKKEDLINEIICDEAKKRFLCNLLKGTENPESESKVA